MVRLRFACGFTASTMLGHVHDERHKHNNDERASHMSSQVQYRNRAETPVLRSELLMKLSNTNRPSESER